MSQNLAVRVVGPAKAIGIHGQMTRKFAIALSDAGILTSLGDSTQPQDVQTEISKEEHVKLVMLGQQQMAPKTFVSIHINSPERITFFDNNAISNIAWTATEADNLPLAHALMLAHPGINEVWVPSQHQKAIFGKYQDLASKISVVKWGVDSKLTYASRDFLDGIKEDGNFYFGFVGSLKKTTGFDVLLRAFYDEFTNDPKVKLVLKTYMGNIPDDKEKETAKTLLTQFKGASNAEVIYLSGRLADQCIDGVISGLDCLVAPYRSKAFGSPILKAMAAGVPTIVNQHTGNKAFCTRDNSIQLASKIGTCIDLEWLMQNPIYQGVSWANIQVEELRRAMRDVYEKKIDTETIIKNGKRSAERYDWPNVVNDVIVAIKKYGVENVK